MINLAGKLLMCGASYHPPSGDIVVSEAETFQGICAAPDTSGALYIPGDNVSSTTINIFKLTDQGTIGWQKNLTLATQLQFTQYAQHSNGDLMLLGKGRASGSYNLAVIVRMSNTGSILWQRKLSITGQNATLYECGIAIDSSGNTYISVGDGLTTNAPDHLCKFNSAGTLQWQRKLSISGVALSGGACVVNASGDVFVSCSCGSYGYIAKYSSDGVLIWKKQYTNSEYLSVIAIDSEGSIYYSAGAGTSTSLYKINSDGAYQWGLYITVAAGYNRNSYKVFIDTDGNPVLLANSNQAQNNPYSLAIVKFDKASATVMRKRVYSCSYSGTKGGIYSYSGIFIKDGYTYFAGFGMQSDGNNDSLIFRTPEDALGAYGWVNITDDAITSTAKSAPTVSDATTLIDAAGTLIDAGGDITTADGGVNYGLTILTKD